MDVPVNALWIELLSLLERSAPGIFAVGDPTAFHSAFEATRLATSRFEHFLSDLSDLTDSADTHNTNNTRSPPQQLGTDTPPEQVESEALGMAKSGETVAGTERALSANAIEVIRLFRTRPAQVEFVNKWNLFVYFQLRFLSITSLWPPCYSSIGELRKTPSYKGGVQESQK